MSKRLGEQSNIIQQLENKISDLQEQITSSENNHRQDMVKNTKIPGDLSVSYFFGNLLYFYQKKHQSKSKDANRSSSKAWSPSGQKT